MYPGESLIILMFYFAQAIKLLIPHYCYVAFYVSIILSNPIPLNDEIDYLVRP